MKPLGAFTFVLHSHMPYARLAGRWPHGEEWVHEAICETYIPLLNALYDLKHEGVNFRLTISITPILAEQLADAAIKANFLEYIDTKITAAQTDILRFNEGPDADTQLAELALWYLAWYENIKRSFRQRYNQDLISAFKQLQDGGFIEITTSAATHGYLPLLGTDSAISAQLQAGIASYERHFGRKPKGIWLPECAYRPAYYAENGTLRPGIETFLAEQGLEVFFSETNAITGGYREQALGTGEAHIHGPYRTLQRRYVIPQQDAIPTRDTTTFKPYYVNDSAQAGSTHSGVTIIGRNSKTSQQVWSADWGYPGDQDYREFHRKDHMTGIQYWRVTGEDVELGEKALYNPEWAAEKVQRHADHFASLVQQELADYAKTEGTYGIIASNYDTELFGHWWFEGTSWLKTVLRNLAKNPRIDLTTPSAFIADNQPNETLNIPEGSWGAGGNHFTWDNEDTAWMWPIVHAAEQRMERLAADQQTPDAPTHQVLQQAARELLLLESSDWPFLVTTGQASEYATKRFCEHTKRFNQLAESIEVGKPNTILADKYWSLDKVFPDIDYRWWMHRTQPVY